MQKTHKKRSSQVDSPPPSIIAEDTPHVSKHWKTLRNVVRASNLLRTQDAEPVQDVNTLIRSVEKIPTDKAYRIKKSAEQFFSPMGQALENHRREQLFFQVIEKGDPKDLEIIQKIMAEDPKKYLRNTTALNSLVNSKNPQGFTPLYLACRNGSIEYVDFFLELGADWNAKVGDEHETCLEAAARWGYHQIVKLLIKKTWSNDVVKRAIKVADNQHIKEILKQTKYNKGCTRCLIY